MCGLCVSHREEVRKTAGGLIAAFRALGVSMEVFELVQRWHPEYTANEARDVETLVHDVKAAVIAGQVEVVAGAILSGVLTHVAHDASAVRCGITARLCYAPHSRTLLYACVCACVCVCAQEFLLFSAVENGDTRMATLLTQRGGLCVDTRARTGFAALHAAAMRGDASMVYTLVNECGANVELLDEVLLCRPTVVFCSRCVNL